MTEVEKTGWPPGLLQDDSKGLSRWFASRIDARWTVRRVCAEIEAARAAAQWALDKLNASPIGQETP